MSRENKCNYIYILKKIPRFMSLIFLWYIACTLLLNVIVDNRINTYYRPNELELPSGIWFGVSVILFLCVLFLMRWCVRKKGINNNNFYGIICVIFAILYLLQVFISSNIYFKTGWDAGVLRGNAENIALAGEKGVSPEYFSRYPNNIFTVYLLVLMYKIANVLHKQNPYGIVIAINNLCVNLSVLLATLSIYRITKKKTVTIVMMIAGTILIGISPWIVIPYTDTLGIVFPITAVFVYVFLKNDYLRYFLITALCGIGYLCKPTVAIFLIALAIIELLSIIKKILCHRLDIKKNLKIAFCILIAIVGVIGLNKSLLKLNKTELDENKAMTITHYLMMGLNEATEGVYCEDDVRYSLSFEDKEARTRGNIEEIKKRYRKMGITGYATLLVKKNLSNYNDGTFAWAREGSFYLETVEKKNLAALFLRKVYWSEGSAYQTYAAVEQVVWFFILLCIICCTLPAKKERSVENLISLTLLGVSLFLLLFECRARYLYIFSPLFIVLAGIGLDKVDRCLHYGLKTSKSREVKRTTLR